MESIPNNTKNLEIIEFIEKHDSVLKHFKTFLVSQSANDYIYDKNELKIVKVDISFINPSTYSENVVDFVKTNISYHPEITPLTHVLKRYLSIKSLNSSFNGGLSSFSLLLMLIAYARYPKTNNITNLGLMLVGFLEFYGKYFNFNQFVIDITNFK